MGGKSSHVPKEPDCKEEAGEENEATHNSISHHVLHIGDKHILLNEESASIAEYCVPFVVIHFCGQTSVPSEKEADKSKVKYVLNLGLYLSLLDKFLKTFEVVTDFTGDEEEYQHILKLVAMKRCPTGDSSDKCYERLQKDSQRFVQLYHIRGEKSENLEHEEYWGTRQQMLSAKVVADWVDKENGPLDPIFGVLLQPTAGRVGPGDSGWIHNILFDDTGYMAYHSAVHDAFGYLITKHRVGPGYNYLQQSILDNDNPMAGQLSGIHFWKDCLKDIESILNDLKLNFL